MFSAFTGVILFAKSAEINLSVHLVLALGIASGSVEGASCITRLDPWQGPIALHQIRNHNGL